MDEGTDAHGIRNALVLAAGDGTRLRPLTECVPKPLLPIDGEPVLGRLLRQLLELGCGHVTTVVGHRGELVRRFVSDAIGDRAELAFVEQAERRGSGHALQLALTAGLARVDTIVAGADTAWDDDELRAMVDGAQRDAPPLVSMGLLRWPVPQLPHASAVRVDDTGRVTCVLKHVDVASRDPEETELAGTPIYVLGGGFWRYVDEVAPYRPGIIRLGDALQDAVDDGHVVRGHEFRSARDLTAPEDLLRANFPYLRPWLDEANAP